MPIETGPGPSPKDWPKHAKHVWFDAHLDLAWLRHVGRDLAAPVQSIPDAAVTFPALRAAPVTGALGTIFLQERCLSTDPLEHGDGPWTYASPDEAYARAMEQFAFYRQWHTQGWLEVLGLEPRHAHLPAPVAKPLRIIILVEGCAGIRNLEDLATFYRAGARVASLTWIQANAYAGGDRSGQDITPAGVNLIRALDRLNMVHDVSHLSEKSFWSLFSHAQRPKIASHSNCRALLPEKKHPERHLSDDQIKAVASAGGMIGINLFGKFLVDQGRAQIADVLRHIHHMTDLVGHSRFLGLGSDMDGGFTTADLPESLEQPQHLGRLLEALSESGWSDDALTDFSHRAWERFFHEHLNF